MNLQNENNANGADLDLPASDAHGSNGVVCQFTGCGRDFSTKAGCSNHMRLAHPDFYAGICSQRLTQESRGRKRLAWTDVEVRRLARIGSELVRLRGRDDQLTGREMSKIMAEKLNSEFGTKRSEESIRKLLTDNRYTKALEEIEAELTTAQTQPQGEEESAASGMEAAWVVCLRQVLRPEITGFEAELLESIAPGEFCEANTAIVDRLFAEFEAQCPGREMRLRPQPPVNLPTNARKRRRILYRRLQKLWKKNRSRACSSVVSGDWRNSGAAVELEQLEPFWRGLFETESTPDSRQTSVGPEGVKWALAQPITAAEILESIKRTDKNTAPGPDGRKLADLEKMPVATLVNQYNVWLLSGCLPTEMCKGRTTLIPKVDGTTDPSKFRPITVSSVLVRVFHRVLAQRMERNCPVADRQKGFRRLDGIAQNVFLLRTAIAAATGAVPSTLYVAFIDVKKAFDSVSHESILLACRRIGIPEPVIEYIRGMYCRSTTRLTVGGRRSDPIRCRQGVKQGEPTSCMIFNYVVDWALSELDPDIGVRIGGLLCQYLGFVDDIVLFARTKDDLSRQVGLAVEAFGKLGLIVNPPKCATMAIVADTSRKLWFVDTEPVVAVNGEWFPALGPQDSYKYLGILVSANGAKASVEAKLKAQLKEITEAPLKPQQKLYILKTNVIPATYHQLVLGEVNLGVMEGLDQLVRNSVKAWLKLPKNVPDGYLYVDYRDGGLGIKSLRFTLPDMKIHRMLRVQRSKDALVAAMAVTDWFSSETSKWQPGTTLGNEFGMECPQSRNSALKLEMIQTADCYGLEYASAVPFIHRWTIDGNMAMSGHRYCAALALRAGTLYSRSRRSRGTDLSSACDCCGPPVEEYLGHILQVCPRTHGSRVHRHNLLLKKLRKFLKLQGWNTILEPRIKLRRSTHCKPDLVFWNHERSLVLDVTVCGDRGSPDQAHRAKVDYYSSFPEVAEWVERTTGHQPSFSALAFNWRGVLSPLSAADLLGCGLRKANLRLLAMVTVEQGTMIHRHFQTSTLRVAGWPAAR